jgi:hypothetical protein
MSGSLININLPSAEMIAKDAKNPTEELRK